MLFSKVIGFILYKINQWTCEHKIGQQIRTQFLSNLAITRWRYSNIAEWMGELPPPPPPMAPRLPFSVLQKYLPKSCNILVPCNILFNVNIKLRSKNTRVSMTRKRVCWGQTPFRVNDDPEISQLDAKYDPELGQSDPIILSIWLISGSPLTRNGVWPQRILFRVTGDPGVFRDTFNDLLKYFEYYNECVLAWWFRFPLTLNPSRVYSGWGLWKMHVIAKSYRLQRINVFSAFSQVRWSKSPIPCSARFIWDMECYCHFGH